MSTTHRLAKGFAATLISQLITAIGNLVLLPIFLAHWGEAKYGEWLMLYAAVAYMTVVDFGVQMYVVNRLNQAFTRREMEDYHRILHSALRLSLTVAGAVIGLVVVAFSSLPVADWFALERIDGATAALCGMLLAFQLVGAIPQALVGGIYRTVGEYHRGVMVTNVQRTLGFALTAAFVATGFGPAEVAAVQLAPLALVTLYVWIDLRRRHPEIAIGVRAGDRREALALLGPSFFFFLIQLSAGLVLQGTTLVVGGALGATVVVVFTATRTLANLIVQVTGSINATLWPDLTALEAQGRHATLRELQRLATKIVLALTLAAAAFLHFNGGLILRLWTHGEVAYDAALMTVFLAHVLYLGFVNTTTMVLIAANRHRQTAILSALAAGLGIALAIPASSWLGVSGVVLAMLVVDVAVRGVALSREACRFIAQPLADYLGEVLGRGVLVGALGFALLWAFHEAAGDASIIVMVASALLSGLVMFGLTFTVWLGDPERRRVLRILRWAR
jgi:O-antigen/teichoic acid export membrane protein